ncbi:unnamed protein product, partial [Polarella glacialis]
VLVAAAQAAPSGGSIRLEIGAYIGHSAVRLAAARPGTRVATLEVDPVHVVIARNLIAFAGLGKEVSVWTGYSRELLPLLAAKYGRADDGGGFSFVFMDQRGSRYEEDLAALVRLNLLRPGAVIVADNVLKPGAPLFLWQVCAKGGGFDTEHSLRAGPAFHCVGTLQVLS